MSKKSSQIVRDTFVTLAQQSMDSIPSDTKQNSRIRGSEYLQDLTIQLPIHHALRTILIEFKKTLKQHSFKCIDICEKQILVIRLTLTDKLKKLFLCKQPPKFIITINTHEFLSVREATIKTLKSNSSFSFPISKSLDLNAEVKKIYQILIGLTHLFRPQEQELGELDGEYQQDFYSLDATSYYMFSRMLIHRNYTLGKKMQFVCEKFNKEDQIETAPKDQLRWLSEALSQMSRDLLQGFNCSRKELLQILAYCRKSVEQYFHSRHNQELANNGLTRFRESDRYQNETRQLQKLVPATHKQLTKLQDSSTSVDIYRTMFMVGLIFRAEAEIKALSEESTGRGLFLIKQCFSGAIGEKSRLLKYSGYHEEDYEDFISKFNFDHEVTF